MAISFENHIYPQFINNLVKLATKKETKTKTKQKKAYIQLKVLKPSWSANLGDWVREKKNIVCPVFVWKRTLFDAFSPTVHTKTIENSHRFHPKRVHAVQSRSSVDIGNGGFRKRWRDVTPKWWLRCFLIAYRGFYSLYGWEAFDALSERKCIIKIARRSFPICSCWAVKDKVLIFMCLHVLSFVYFLYCVHTTTETCLEVNVFIRNMGSNPFKPEVF